MSLCQIILHPQQWPESSGQSPQRCQCLEVLPMALPLSIGNVANFDQKNGVSNVAHLPLLATPPTNGNVASTFTV